MNSHQSLAEALETCKYTENFTSHGARSCSHGNPPRTPPDGNKTSSSTYSSISGYVPRHIPTPNKRTQHRNIRSHIQLCVPAVYHLQQKEKQKAPRFTSHFVVFAGNLEKRNLEREKRCAIGLKKQSVQETSARFTHTNIRFTLDII
ncbi:hypothetical protein PAMP_009925 [Pampus punctatissimus]